MKILDQKEIKEVSGGCSCYCYNSAIGKEVFTSGGLANFSPACVDHCRQLGFPYATRCDYRYTG